MLEDHWILWLTAISVFTFVGSLLALPWLVSQIPADYFLHNRREPAGWKEVHPLLRLTAILGKNLLGITLLLGGFLMLFIPGQGLLTMAMGLVLMDYPGKFRLERRIVSIPAIHKGLNWLRNRRGIKPLQLD